MNIRRVVKDWCYKHLYLKRVPDLYVGGKEKPYMLRWYVIPRNPIFNIYFHIFLRSDYAEALHDHPWAFNMSLLLDGNYTEHVPGVYHAGSVPPFYMSKAEPDYTRTNKIERKEGDFAFRWGKAPHRVQLHEKPYPWDSEWTREDPCSTLFITGPKIRKWGFYCPKGWRPWQAFLGNYTNAHEGLDTNGCD